MVYNRDMKPKTFSYTLQGKRPAYATDELALQRHDQDGLSYRQIAQEWGISAGMVERMVHRARRRSHDHMVAQVNEALTKPPVTV